MENIKFEISKATYEEMNKTLRKYFSEKCSKLPFGSEEFNFYEDLYYDVYYEEMPIEEMFNWCFHRLHCLDFDIK